MAAAEWREKNLGKDDNNLLLIKKSDDYIFKPNTMKKINIMLLFCCILFGCDLGARRNANTPTPTYESTSVEMSETEKKALLIEAMDEYQPFSIDMGGKKILYIPDITTEGSLVNVKYNFYTLENNVLKKITIKD